MYSEVLSKTVRYSSYFPPDYALSSKAYPVLYLLHGGGPGKDTDLTGPSRIPWFMNTLIAEGGVLPMIIVSPDARRDDTLRHATFYMNDADGAFRWKDMFFQEFMPYIENRYRVLKRPGAPGSLRAIAGISMGGFGALSYAMRHPGLFASAAALSASLRTAFDIEDMDQPEYEKRYGKVLGAKLKGKDRMATQYPDNCPLCLAKAKNAADLAQTRFFFDCGAEDCFVTGASLLHTELRAKKIPHSYLVRPGEHDWEYWRGALPDMLRFISQGFAESLATAASARTAAHR